MQRSGVIDPATVVPLNSWVLVREDPPRDEIGILVVPDTSRYRGRQITVCTVLRIPRNPHGVDKDGNLWELPPEGSRVAIPAIAHRPDTQTACQELFCREGDKGRYFFVHAMDLLVVLEPEFQGEREPVIE